MRVSKLAYLYVHGQIASLRMILEGVEALLQSIRSSPPGDAAIGSAEKDITAISTICSHISATLKELDSLVDQKLSKPASESGPQHARTAKLTGWLRHVNQLKRHQATLRAQAALLNGALSTLQTSLQITQQRRPVSVTIQQLTVAPSFNLPAAATAVSHDVIHGQLEQILAGLILSPQGAVNPHHTPALPAARGNSTQPAIATGEKNALQLVVAPAAMQAIRIQASVTTEPNRRVCHCQCHSSTRFRTPRWSKDVFGSLVFHSNATTNLQRKPCSWEVCKTKCSRSGRVATTFTYYSPTWAWLGVVHATVSRQAVFGMGASLGITCRRLTPSVQIWKSIEQGSAEDVQDQLLKGTASIFDISLDGESLLHYAGRVAKPEICALLISLGADVFYSAYSGVPAFSTGLDHYLTNPVHHSNLPSETVSRFSDIYGDEEIYDNLELTLIHRIVLGLSSANLEIQLGYSAKEINTPDAEGRTPIWWAARRGDVEKLKVLLEHGADPNVKDINDVTPLHKAVADGGDDCVALLLEVNALVNVADDGGAHPIHGVSFSPHHRPRTIEMLVTHGADVNAPSNEGARPLHWCVGSWTEATRDTIPNMQTLIDFGADLEAADETGYTAVMDAVYHQVLPAFEFLLAKGAQLDRKTTKGCTILHIAAWRGTVECWEMLLRAAEDGRMTDVDVYAGHCGHDASDCCMGKCRDDWFPGKRRPKDEEMAVFMKLVDCVERRSMILADEDSTVTDDAVAEEPPAVTISPKERILAEGGGDAATQDISVLEISYAI